MVAVETFECTETAAEPIEATEEAVGIIEKLGLKGQQKLLKPKSDDGPASRCPYREMTADEQFVYGELCPKATALSKYDASPIPLRVLQIAAHAESLEMFTHLYVWDRESAEVQDPVLVAYTGQYDFSPEKIFILARWGEVLETFAVLMKRAIEVRRQKWIQQAKQIASRIETMVDTEVIKKCSRYLARHRDIDW